jgi:enoyl-CoA hydratase
VDPTLEGLESLRVHRGELYEVVLLGPGKGNALGPAFWREAPRVARALDEAPEVRAILLRGEGAHFSFGLDLPAMSQELAPLIFAEGAGARARTGLGAQVERMQDACEAWARCHKPVIAAVQGWCIGGAISLVSACDVRLCSQDARFSLREVKLAIVPDLGALQRLPRLIGEGQARRLALTGEDFDAGLAERIGLVSAVLPSPEALLAEARRLGAELAQNPPLAVQGVKQVMERCAGLSVAEGLRLSALWSAAFLQSEDFQEALAAFAERRPPRFSGR